MERPPKATMAWTPTRHAKLESNPCSVFASANIQIDKIMQICFASVDQMPNRPNGPLALIFFFHPHKFSTKGNQWRYSGTNYIKYMLQQPWRTWRCKTTRLLKLYLTASPWKVKDPDLDSLNVILQHLGNKAVIIAGNGPITLGLFPFIYACDHWLHLHTLICLFFCSDCSWRCAEQRWSPERRIYGMCSLL